MDRRKVLKGMVALAAAPKLLAAEDAELLTVPQTDDVMLKKLQDRWVAPAQTGVEFPYILQGIHVEALSDNEDHGFQTVWVKRPNGDIVLMENFDPHAPWCWIAAPGMAIIGPVFVDCSCPAVISLGGDQGIKSVKT
jgi:hypothetical protein